MEENLKELKKHLNEDERKYVENNKEIIEKICNIQCVITMNNLLNLQ